MGRQITAKLISNSLFMIEEVDDETDEIKHSNMPLHIIIYIIQLNVKSVYIRVIFTVIIHYSCNV